MKKMLIKLNKDQAKNIWIQSQMLHKNNFFGRATDSVAQVISHLGYVQIDTINVIERCHHHILYNRIAKYQRKDLIQAQTINKSIFEYWTHALSYIPTTDFKYFVPRMKNVNVNEGSWFGAVTKKDYKKVMSLIDKGPLSVRDIKDDILKEKEHEWDSKKPSKRALQLGFHKGELVICRREGMLKVYDLTTRHFNWNKLPAAVSEKEYYNYRLDRGLRAQGLVSLDSLCHLEPKLKKNMLELIKHREKLGQLKQVQVGEHSQVEHWCQPELLDEKIKTSQLCHILSPFDPLVIQRKRLKLFFEYDHIFEAYLPKAKRKYGYFTLPVLNGNQIVALLDLKTDRLEKKLLIQNWVWLGKHKNKENKLIIESELSRFEKFQLGI